MVFLLGKRRFLLCSLVLGKDYSPLYLETKRKNEFDRESVVHQPLNVKAETRVELAFDTVGGSEKYSCFFLVLFVFC